MNAHNKFELIKEATSHDFNQLNISWMCNVAGVSRSGYYAWLDAEEKRIQREEQDKADFERVLEAYNYRGYAKGARSIYMRLLRKRIRMNIKKIRRLMKKFGLKCPYRVANPYKQMARNIKTNAVFPNIVDRNFEKLGPRKVLLTDITYLFYGKNVCYLSTIIDAFTKEILAYKLSKSLEVTFVIQTIEQLVNEHGATLDDTATVHSDQGCHYTSKAFIQALKDNNFVQSMSRRGNCWDNAPQESFFGHMKDEIREEISMMEDFEDVKEKIDDWMDYYNNDRYQWDLDKLAPKEYYRYVVYGINPLVGIWGSAPNPGI